MSRIFVERTAVKGSIIEITDREDIKHLLKVLRLGTGDKIEVSDSSEFEYSAEILSAEPSLITVRILDKQRFAREPELKITLFQGIPKQGKMEDIIRKSVESGAFSIVPVFTERTIVTEKQNFGRKVERWQKISAEAVKQCKRGLVPEIGSNLSFGKMLNQLKEFDLVLIPYEDEEERTIKDVLRNTADKPKSVAIIIGPEGGFSDNEVLDAASKGAIPVSLGKPVLRTETAGPAAIAMVMYEFEL